MIVDPPFHTFKIQHPEPEFDDYTYHIEKLLDNDIVLVRIMQNDMLKTYRIGKFAYEEGIGGREIVDTEHFNFISYELIKSTKWETCEYFKPTKRDIKSILAVVAKEKSPFMKMPIEVID